MPDFVEMIADYRNDTLYKWEGQAEQGLLNWCADAGPSMPEAGRGALMRVSRDGSSPRPNGGMGSSR